MNKPRWIFFNGELKKADERLLPVESRAVWYGDGCFETLRSYRGKFLKADVHLQRLKGGLNYLGIDIPEELDNNILKNSIAQLLERNKLQNSDAVVRIQVWREGDRGFKPDENARMEYAISVLPMPEILSSVRLATVSTIRIPSKALDPRFKLSNSINYIRAAKEAEKQGGDDALMLTVEEKIAETTVANVFWLKGETVYTPSESCDILPGITRRMVIEILEGRDQSNYHLVKGVFPLEELWDAEMIWICNSLRELQPVQSIDEHEFTTSHPFFNTLSEWFEKHKIRELKSVV